MLLLNYSEYTLWIMDALLSTFKSEFIICAELRHSSDDYFKTQQGEINGIWPKTGAVAGVEENVTIRGSRLHTYDGPE